MSDMKWMTAIKKVLKDEGGALHYTQIAELIVNKGLRKKVGATPASTVNAYINNDINKNPEKSSFVRSSVGEYMLKDSVTILENVVIDDNHASDNEMLINSYGIYWSREMVLWKSSPDLYGVQQVGADNVNFNKQIGIYLLHDIRETIYVGQAIKQTIGERLYQHTLDRLSGRWDRFSWFGFYVVSDEGKILDSKEIEHNKINAEILANVLEAVLIESIEPRQNRKKGNSFSGIEYLQHEDPEIVKKRVTNMLEDLKSQVQ